MVTRLQGWRDEWGWRFSGRKTARYRQIGNAFPPPVAEAVGTAIRRALEHADSPGWLASAPGGHPARVHDPVFRVLRSRDDFLTTRQLADLAGAAVRAPAGRPAGTLSPAEVLAHLRHLSQDFELEIAEGRDGPAYRLGRFRAFLGQQDHARHRLFTAARATIS